MRCGHHRIGAARCRGRTLPIQILAVVIVEKGRASRPPFRMRESVYQTVPGIGGRTARQSQTSFDLLGAAPGVNDELVRTPAQQRLTTERVPGGPYTYCVAALVRAMRTAVDHALERRTSPNNAALAWGDALGLASATLRRTSRLANLGLRRRLPVKRQAVDVSRPFRSAERGATLLPPGRIACHRWRSRVRAGVTRIVRAAPILAREACTVHAYSLPKPEPSTLVLLRSGFPTLRGSQRHSFILRSPVRVHAQRSTASHCAPQTVCSVIGWTTASDGAMGASSKRRPAAHLPRHLT